MKDYVLEPGSMAAERLLAITPSVAASVVDRPFAVIPVTAPSILTRLGLWCRDVTGSVGIQAFLSTGDGVFSSPTLAIHSTADQFTIAAFGFRNGAVVGYTAAQTALQFSQNFTITNNKFGISRIQMTAAGVVSTVEPGAAMAYDSAALALAALPALTAGSIDLGYVIIAPTAGDFTANTTNLTTIGTFTNVTPVAGALTGNATFVDGTPVAGTLENTIAELRINTGGYVVLTATGDGTAALVDAQVYLGIRPFPLKGEVWQ